MKERDSGKVGQDIEAPSAGWSFADIAESFDDHVEKSVPLYHEGHELVCELSDFFLHDRSLVIELGTSTGALAAKILAHNKARTGLSYRAIDREKTMLDRAAARCEGDPRISFVCEDVANVEFDPCNMVVSYYTMQFVHPSRRQELFNRIYEALEWGGAFVLFEKVRAPDARFQDIASQLYHEYKLGRHFDGAEILQKQRSLKGVLEPFSTGGNLDLLARAGFVDVMSVMKWVCFEGFLAIK